MTAVFKRSHFYGNYWYPISINNKNSIYSLMWVHEEKLFPPVKYMIVFFPSSSWVFLYPSPQNVKASHWISVQSVSWKFSFTRQKSSWQKSHHASLWWVWHSLKSTMAGTLWYDATSRIFATQQLQKQQILWWTSSLFSPFHGEMQHVKCPERVGECQQDCYRGNNELVLALEYRSIPGGFVSFIELIN